MSQPKAPSPWRIINPVRPQIRRAMAIATAAAVLSTAALLVMARILKDLLNDQADWWLAALLLVLTLATFAVRAYAFRVSHLAAFRLETLLRSQLAERLAQVSLGFLRARRQRRRSRSRRACRTMPRLHHDAAGRLPNCGRRTRRHPFRRRTPTHHHRPRHPAKPPHSHP